MAKKLGRKAAESVRRDDEPETAYSFAQKKLAEGNGATNSDEGGVAVAEPPKKRGRKGQKEFEGSGFPGPPPEDVCEARDQYLSSMRSHAKTAKKKCESEQALIEAMHKHDIKRVQLDGENKYFEIEAPEKIKTKTIPKEQRDERSARENAG